MNIGTNIKVISYSRTCWWPLVCQTALNSEKRTDEQDTRVGKEKNLSPSLTGIEPMTSRTPGRRSHPLSYVTGFISFHKIPCWLSTQLKAPSTVCRRKLKTAFFTLKTHQMISVHTTPEKFENTSDRSPVLILDCAWRKLGQGDYMSIVGSLISKSFVF